MRPGGEITINFGVVVLIVLRFFSQGGCGAGNNRSEYRARAFDFLSGMGWGGVGCGALLCMSEEKSSLSRGLKLLQAGARKKHQI